jgi:TPR repeat protein
MADIFISYSREDEQTAQHLRDVLVSQGYDVWRDKEGIITGKSWEKSIEEALTAAKCVIVLWSRAALGSHFVRDEAEVGRNAGKLVPVQIDNSEIPLGFRGIQTANLGGWRGEIEHPEYRKLVRAIESRVGQGSGPLTPPKVIGPPWWKRLSAIRLPGGATTLAAVAALLLMAGGFAAGRYSAGGSGDGYRDALEQGLRQYFDQKYVEAESNLRTAYGKGSGLAAYYLARMYRDGQGVKADDAKALEWAVKGADRGNALAQNTAGLLYSAGRGTKKDDAAAFAMYQKAADQGQRYGLYNLARSYENGSSVKSDVGKAYDYYRRAGDDGNGGAFTQIGDMYMSGRGMAADPARAAIWWKSAADLCDAAGSNSLGVAYLNGRGVAQSDARALDLFKRAADVNSPTGLLNVGFMYENGRGGVVVDLNQAASYYKRAADIGERSAPAALARVQERQRLGGGGATRK